MDVSNALAKMEMASSVTALVSSTTEKSITALADELGLPTSLTVQEMEFNMGVGDDVEE